MADNVAITAGTGTTIATDEVGGAHYQIFKPAFGALDTATLVGPGDGLPVSSQPLFELLSGVLAELQTISQLLQIGLSIPDDPADIRDDILTAKE